jgi:hypothetical protein
MGKRIPTYQLKENCMLYEEMFPLQLKLYPFPGKQGVDQSGKA